MHISTAYTLRRIPTTPARRIVPAHTFEEWVGSRLLASPSTNAGAPALPFQTWHRFKEAFSPELVELAVAGSSRQVRRLCDPFGGSGTSALAAQFLGIESVSIEVNPFLADLIRAKVSRYDISELLSALPRVARRARRGRYLAAKAFATLPPTFIEPGHQGRWLFDDAVASKLAAIRHSISLEGNPNIRRLLKVLLGGMLVSVSNVVVSGKGRRYRRRWEHRRADPTLIDSVFCQAVSNAIVEIDANRRRASVGAKVILGDSREVLWKVEPVDLIVCSPPYPNSFDYTDVYNIELWMLGYLRSSADNRRLRESTLSSHVQIRREFAAAPRTRTLTRTMSRLRNIRNKLWDEHIVEMVGGYFADLRQLLEASAEALKARGQAWLVVGDSQYGGVRIRVADILTELAEGSGLRIVRREPFRSMRLSPQQGGDHKLAENLLIFEKS